MNNKMIGYEVHGNPNKSNSPHHNNMTTASPTLLDLSGRDKQVPFAQQQQQQQHNEEHCFHPHN